MTCSAVAYTLFLSACCMVLRRLAAWLIMRTLGPSTIPTGPAAGMSDTIQELGSNVLPRHLVKHVHHPLDMSWIWAIWLLWQLTWVVWRADSPAEKDSCFMVAMVPVWILCGLLFGRHYYASFRRTRSRVQSMRSALGAAIAESFLLFVLATILSAHLHLSVGGAC